MNKIKILLEIKKGDMGIFHKEEREQKTGEPNQKFSTQPTIKVVLLKYQLRSIIFWIHQGKGWATKALGDPAPMILGGPVLAGALCLYHVP